MNIPVGSGVTPRRLGLAAAAAGVACQVGAVARPDAFAAAVDSATAPLLVGFLPPLPVSLVVAVLARKRDM